MWSGVCTEAMPSARGQPSLLARNVNWAELVGQGKARHGCPLTGHLMSPAIWDPTGVPRAPRPAPHCRFCSASRARGESLMSHKNNAGCLLSGAPKKVWAGIPLTPRTPKETLLPTTQGCSTYSNHGSAYSSAQNLLGFPLSLNGILIPCSGFRVHLQHPPHSCPRANDIRPFPSPCLGPEPSPLL